MSNYEVVLPKSHEWGIISTIHKGIWWCSSLEYLIKLSLSFSWPLIHIHAYQSLPWTEVHVGRKVGLLFLLLLSHLSQFNCLLLHLPSHFSPWLTHFCLFICFISPPLLSTMSSTHTRYFPLYFPAPPQTLSTHIKSISIVHCLVALNELLIPSFMFS